MDTERKEGDINLLSGSSVEVPVHPDVRLAMLAANTSGSLGSNAYKKVFDLDPVHLKILAAFAETLAEYKELAAQQSVDTI